MGWRRAVAGGPLRSSALAAFCAVVCAPVPALAGANDRLDLSLGLYNLFDRRYGDPATVADAAAIDRLPQPGRTFRAKFDYRF